MIAKRNIKYACVYARARRKISLLNFSSYGKNIHGKNIQFFLINIKLRNFIFNCTREIMYFLSKSLCVREKFYCDKLIIKIATQNACEDKVKK